MAVRTRRLPSLWPTIAVVVLLAGCTDGGGTDSERADGTIPVAGPTAIAEASGVIVEEFGDRGGFYVAFTATDDGFDAVQIVHAARAGTLQPDGTIDGAEPARPPAGLLGEPVEPGERPAGFRALAETPSDREVPSEDTTLSDIFDRYERNRQAAEAQEDLDRRFEDGLTQLTIALSARGYSARQIIDAVTSFEALPQIEESEPGNELTRFVHPDCYLVARDGQVVRPELPPALGLVGECPPLDDAVIPDLSPPDAPEDGSDSPTPPAASGTYRFDAVFLIEGEGASLRTDWTGSFDVDGSTIVGAGSARSSSSGACSIEDGAPHRYEFTTTWDFTISGTAGGGQLEPVITPDASTVSLSEGSGTESDAACVGFARDAASGGAGLQLGAEPYGISVPASGGTTQIGEAPSLVDITITPG